MHVNKKTGRTLASLLLLMVFTIGQAIVYGHSHYSLTSHMHKDSKKVRTDTRCQICDQNAQVHLFLDSPPNYLIQLSQTITAYFFVPAYQGIELLLSGNRGPPLG